MTAKGYHPVMVAKQGCTGCGICALVCPEAALTVYREALRTRIATPMLAHPLGVGD